MREILFRGKRVDTGEWLEGDLVHSTRYLNGVTTHHWFIGVDMDFHEVIPETVGQFTGLTDKNGKKIFEGDVCVRYLDAKKLYTDGKTWKDYWLIEWLKETAGFSTTKIADFNVALHKVIFHNPKRNSFSQRFSEVEIIGNIHDNPELLKGGQQ